jgi:hypothetical protein
MRIVVGKIYAALLQFFDEWFFAQNDEETFLRLWYDGKNGKWDAYAQAREEQEQFVFYSIYPKTVSEGRRSAMAELLTRINYGLVLGNFELDYADGEVRYKTSIDVEHSELTADLIKPVVFANLGTMDRYWASLTAILEDGVGPQEALALVEQ